EALSRGVARVEVAGDAEDVDVARRGIDARGCPGDAVRRHVRVEDVEALLPDQLARVGVEAEQALLGLLALFDGVDAGVEQVQAVAEDGGSWGRPGGRPPGQPPPGGR